MSPVINYPQRQKWKQFLGQFLSGQLTVQFLNTLIGFLLLRWLTKLEVAQFGLASAFQATLSSLIDLGFSGSIVTLVGENKANRSLVGNYIRAALQVRARLSVLGIVGICLIFPLVTLRQGWDLSTTLILLVFIIATVLIQSQMIYSAPLLIYGHLKPFYKSQVISSLSRLLLTFSLYIFGLLSAATATCVVALATAINGTLYRKSALPLFEETQDDSQRYTKDMIRYLSPMMPVIVFSTLQNQIVMALASWFGKTANIAEVAALGRLGQLFVILGAFNSVAIQPYIASVSRTSLTLRYFQILAGSIAVATSLSFIAWMFPSLFLWFLGENFRGLSAEVSSSIAAGCLYYVAGVIFTMNAARKWVFWWSTVFEIALLICIDILCARFADLTTTLGLIKFSIVTGFAFLLIHTINGIYGLVWHRDNN